MVGLLLLYIGSVYRSGLAWPSGQDKPLGQTCKSSYITREEVIYKTGYKHSPQKKMREKNHLNQNNLKGIGSSVVATNATIAMVF